MAGDGDNHLNQARDDDINDTPEEASRERQDYPRNHRDGNGAKPDEERRTRSVEDARPHVAPAAVGPEEVFATGGLEGGCVSIEGLRIDGLEFRGED